MKLFSVVMVAGATLVSLVRSNSLPKGCRSGSIEFCGEPDTAGPHCIECLRALWLKIGCKPHGERGPDQYRVNVDYWNNRTVRDVKNNMKLYKKFVPFSRAYAIHCYGLERKDVTNMAKEYTSVPSTSPLPVTVSSASTAYADVFLDSDWSTSRMTASEAETGLSATEPEHAHSAQPDTVTSSIVDEQNINYSVTSEMIPSDNDHDSDTRNTTLTVNWTAEIGRSRVMSDPATTRPYWILGGVLSTMATLAGAAGYVVYTIVKNRGRRGTNREKDAGPLHQMTSSQSSKSDHVKDTEVV